MESCGKTSKYFKNNTTRTGFRNNKKGGNDQQNNEKKVQIASCQTGSSNNLPIIKINIKGLEGNALIDSGAAVSLISPSFFEQVKEKVKINYISRSVRIQTLDSTTIPFQKTVEFSFKIGDKNVKNTYFVTTKNFSENYDLILGFDFLKNNEVTLNCIENKIIIKNTPVTINGNMSKENPKEKQENLKRKRSKKPLIVNNVIVKLECKTKIMPNQTSIITLICDQETPIQADVALYPYKNKTGIILDEAIYSLDDNNKILTPITNNSDKVITLNKGMKLGEITTEFQEKPLNKIRDLEILQINNLKTLEIEKLRQRDLTEEDFDVSHLPDSQKQQILEMLMQNYAVFSKTYMTLGETSEVTPIFKLSHEFPIQSKAYNLPHNVKQFAEKELNDLLKAGIIEESTSNYAFPVIFVKKKTSKTDNPANQKYRMAIDYRLLNQITELFPYKLPDIKEILHKISGHELFTVLDLKSAFFQIKLQENDKEKLAFTTEFGNFQPTRLPFGAKNSSSYFALLMKKCLGPVQHLNINFFLDDIIIPANTIEDMIKKLQAVLDQLKKFNLTLDPKKLQIIKPEIEYLGYKISKNGFSPSDKNIQKINEFPKPKNSKQVKSFLGMTNYFRDLIWNYSEVVQPLINLTKTKSKFTWTEETQDAFTKIQNLILKSPTLHHADYSRQFYLISDASKIAISSILMQKYDDQYVPIEFYSRKLKDTESKYPSFKSELLAIHDSLIHFKNYLFGKKFTILTDAKSLTYYLKLQHQSDIVARWLLDIQEFDFEIYHVQGISNPADYFSRQIFSVNSTKALFKTDPQLQFDKISRAQKNDDKLKTIIENITTKTNAKEKNHYVYDSDKELLMFKFGKRKQNKHRVVVPNTLIPNVMKEAHSAHLSINKTYKVIQKTFYWKGMYADIKNFCLNCVQCNLYKTRVINKNPLTPVSKNYQPGECIAIDIVGKLPRSNNGHNFIVTIIDYFSRYFEAYPVRNITANAIINCVNRYIASYGLPKIIISDNGTQFKSREFGQLMQALAIEHRQSSIYYPMGNSTIERSHRTMKEAVAALSNESFSWHENLLFFKLHYNATIHRATGFSPSMLFFCRELRTPFYSNEEIKLTESHPKYIKEKISEINKIRRVALQNQKNVDLEYNKINENRHPKELNVGDVVFVKSFTPPNTFGPKQTGPYTVLKKVRNNNFILRTISDPHSKPIKVNGNKIFQTPSPRSNINKAANGEQSTSKSDEINEIKYFLRERNNNKSQRGG